MESAGTAYFGYAVPTIRLEEWFVGSRPRWRSMSRLTIRLGQSPATGRGPGVILGGMSYRALAHLRISNPSRVWTQLILVFSQVEVRLFVINRPKSAIAAAVGLRQGHMLEHMF